jgi:Fur family ferric uptake transcriptional regulator
VTQDVIEQVNRFLKEQGLRSTRARQAIVETLLETEGHFTADELLDRIKAGHERASRASVYRTLAILVDGGFVESREFERGQLRYEVMAGQHHHDHLICTGCGAIIEFECEEIEELQRRVARDHDYLLEHHSLRLFGRCPACRKNAG